MQPIGRAHPPSRSPSPASNVSKGIAKEVLREDNGFGIDTLTLGARASTSSRNVLGPEVAAASSPLSSEHGEGPPRLSGARAEEGHKNATSKFPLIETGAEAIEKLRQEHFDLFERTPLEEFPTKVLSSAFSNDWREKLEILKVEVEKDAEMKISDCKRDFDRDTNPLPFSFQTREQLIAEIERNELRKKNEALIQNVCKERLEVIDNQKELWNH